MCYNLAQCAYNFASVNHYNVAMNTDNTLSYISAMLSSDTSYRALLDMIDEMDLEIMGVNAA